MYPSMWLPSIGLPSLALPIGGSRSTLAVQQHEVVPRFAPRPGPVREAEPALKHGPSVGDGPSSAGGSSLLTPQRLIESSESRATPLEGSWWPLWWEHNKFEVLDLRRLTHSENARWEPELVSSSGRGLAPEPLDARVLPAVLEALSQFRDPVAIRSALIAVGRLAAAPASSGAAGPPRALSVAAGDAIVGYLRHPDASVAETAVLALGSLADMNAALRLVDLLVDEERGRELCARRDGVPIRMRAMAAFAIAHCARGAQHAELARFCVHNLARVLDGEEEAAPDLEAACVAAIGLIPLGPFSVPSEVDTRRGPSPSESLCTEVETLISWLRRGRSKQTMRSIHAPTALARLVGGLDSRSAHLELRARVVEALLECLEARGSGNLGGRRSAALALGMIGTAGVGAVEERLRSALSRAISGKDTGTSAFALMALAQVGSRPGWKVDSPFAATPEIELELLTMLRRGRSQLRPWAGLALGVLGHELRAKGQRLTQESGDLLLERVRETRTPEEGTAYSLAAALIGDGRAFEAIERDLVSFTDEASLGDLALGLGLLGNRRSIDSLQKLSRDALHRPRILEQASIARALLADDDLVPDLLEKLEEVDCWTSAAAVCRSLAWTADSRALDALLDLLTDGARSERERSVAAEALGWVGAPDPRALDIPFAIGANYTAAPPTLTSDDSLGMLDRF